MNRVASAITSAGYRHVVKPVLFTQPPDAVHRRLVRTGTAFQQLAAARGAVNKAWAFRHPILEQHIAGIHFANPVGLSAGFDKNFELVPLMQSIGFGFMEGGSITFRPCAGNPRPWFYRLPKSGALVVNAGLANHGAAAVLARLAGHVKGPAAGFPVNISVAKTNSPEACSIPDAIADYTGTLKLIQEHGLGQMITLNISCPNTYGGQPFTTPDRLEGLLEAVDKLNLRQPVFVKMPAHLPWPEFQGLVDVAARHNVAGLTIANLIYRNQAQLSDHLPDSVPGKIGGRPNFEISNNLIRQTRLHAGNRFVIIGVGGIFTAEDAYTKIKLGANLVEIITGLIYQGPSVVGHMNRRLAHLITADGYRSVAEAVGRDLT